MGFAGIGGKFRVELLAGQKTSTEAYSNAIKAMIRSRLDDITFDDVKPSLREKFGFAFPGDPGADGNPLLLSSADIAALKKAFAKDVQRVRVRARTRRRTMSRGAMSSRGPRRTC